MRVVPIVKTDDKIQCERSILYWNIEELFDVIALMYFIQDKYEDISGIGMVSIGEYECATSGEGDILSNLYCVNSRIYEIDNDIINNTLYMDKCRLDLMSESIIKKSKLWELFNELDDSDS